MIRRNATARIGSDLNEVLSIRAQESDDTLRDTSNSANLNEVLSIRAQESPTAGWPSKHCCHLNEVLSIRAQEYGLLVAEIGLRKRTSMKS